MDAAFRFHLLRNTPYLHIKEYADSVESTAYWLQDYYKVLNIINQLSKNSWMGLENDRKNLFALGRGKFFFNKMQRWMSLRDQKIGFVCTFNTGICFTVDSFIRKPEYPYRFIIKPREDLYAQGAVYKRFGNDSFIIVFERGEAFVAARTENDAYWIAGVLNAELLSASSKPQLHLMDNTEPLYLQSNLDELTFNTQVLRTEELEALEVKKYYDVNFPPLTPDGDGFTVIRRRQPRRVCKEKKNVE